MKLTDFTTDYELNYVVQEIFMDCLAEFGSNLSESIEEDCKYKSHVIRASDGKRIETSGFSLNLSGLKKRVKNEEDLEKLIKKINNLDDQGVFVKSSNAAGITPCQKAIEAELSYLFDNSGFSLQDLLDDIKYSLSIYLNHADVALIKVPVSVSSSMNENMLTHTDILVKTTIITKLNESLDSNIDSLMEHTLAFMAIDFDLLNEGSDSLKISKVVGSLQSLEKLFDKDFDKLKRYINKHYNELKKTGVFVGDDSEAKKCSITDAGSCGMAFLGTLNRTIKNYRKRFLELNK